MKQKFFFRKIALLAVLMMETAEIFAGGRIYYAGDYSTPYIWAWSGDSHVYDNWPGQQMTALGEQFYGKNIYYVEITSWYLNPAQAIFSENGSDNNKTTDLNIPGWGYLYDGYSWVAYPYSGGDGWFISGQLKDEASAFDHKMTVEGNIATYSCTLAAGKEYWFKVKHLDNGTKSLYSSASTLNQTTASDVDFSASLDGNAALATKKEGTYTFSLNLSTMHLTVTYPNALAPELIYSTSVPAENEDVLIQAYYWAHEENSAMEWTPYGSIHWTDLTAQASELGHYFNLVWLAPSGETQDHTGFLPTNYSDQNSHVWGTETELKTLIDSLHAANAKVVADIVINHSSPGGENNYCNWGIFDFGEYGVYYPDKSWIASEDEIFIYENDDRYKRYDNDPKGENAGIRNAAWPCGDVEGTVSDEWDCVYQGGHKAWSWAEYNCVYSRDWAHAKKEVREMSRAYLTWMKEYIGYDGWRYDFAKGFHGSHIDEYNKASNACFSVAEVFDGDIEREIGVLETTHYNTYVFDFPAKYQIMNDGIRNGNYYKLVGNATSTMLYKYKRNTVTFVDNHDTFREDYNLCGSPNTISNPEKVIMANAYILAMPGVPCVFYPYWHEYKTEIKAMINARRAARVHSESAVVDEAGSGYYKATITGKTGSIRLLLGPSSGWQNCPDGYMPAYVDNNIGFYYQAPGIYIKHNWDNSGWSWKAMDDNGDGTYSVIGIYGGTGCNWVDSLPSNDINDPNVHWVETPTIIGSLEIGQEALFTLNPSTGEITIEATIQPVYFANSQNWGNVYAYMWNDDNSNNHDWPGEAMTIEGTFNGNSIYKYIPNSSYQHIIFNIGSNAKQTGTLTCKEGLCYIPEGDEGGALTNDSYWHSLNSLTHELAISECGWTTTYLPFNVTLPDGVYAYYASARANNAITLSLIEGAVPAKTGVLIKGSENTHTLTATANFVAPIDESMFEGTKVATSIGTNNYVLSKSLSSVNTPVFGLWDNESALPAAKAYLHIENMGGAPEIRFVMEEEQNATNIDRISVSDEIIKQLRNGQLVIIRDGVMYNALGQRVL